LRFSLCDVKLDQRLEQDFEVRMIKPLDSRPDGKKCADKSQFFDSAVKLGDGRVGIKRGQYRNAAEPIRSAGDHGGELIIHDASCLDRKGTIFKKLREGLKPRGRDENVNIDLVSVEQAQSCVDVNERRLARKERAACGGFDC
jgi:hypothetical protein